MKNKEQIVNLVETINKNLQLLQSLWEKNEVQKWIDHTIENECDETIPVEDVDLAYELGAFGDNLREMGRDW